MPCTKRFTRDTLLGRLEAVELSLRQHGELTIVETNFGAISDCPCLSRSASTNEDCASSNKSRYEEDIKIEEGITLIVRREPNGKKVFNVGLVINLVIFLLSVLKERTCIREISSLDKLDIACM